MTKEDLLIINLWPNHSIAAISLELGRTRKWIGRRAQFLKLPRKRPQLSPESQERAILNRAKAWKAGQTNIMHKYGWPEPTTTISDALMGRTYDSYTVPQGLPIDGRRLVQRYGRMGSAAQMCVEG